MVAITINDPKLEKPINYFMEPYTQDKLDRVVKPSLLKKDEDYIIAVDGAEGTGKSTLAQQLGKYVDPTLNLDRIVFTPEDFREAIYKAKKGQCVIYDEAFTGFSSRSSLSGINRTLVSLMMQIRQKNLFIIIVLPTFFLLDRYISLFRTKVLIHVYKIKGRRGFYNIYSKKRKKGLIMSKEAKTYSYNRAIKPNKRMLRFYGVFALGHQKEEDKYRKQKLEALEKTEQNPINATAVKNREQRDLLIFLVRKELKLSYRKMESLLEEYGLGMSFKQIQTICLKYGALTDEELEKMAQKMKEEETNKAPEDQTTQKEALTQQEEPETLEKEEETEQKQPEVQVRKKKHTKTPKKTKSPKQNDKNDGVPSQN